jgi:hypothetical protein
VPVEISPYEYLIVHERHARTACATSWLFSQHENFARKYRDHQLGQGLNESSCGVYAWANTSSSYTGKLTWDHRYWLSSTSHPYDQRVSNNAFMGPGGWADVHNHDTDIYCPDFSSQHSPRPFTSYIVTEHITIAILLNDYLAAIAMTSSYR